jgi:hypothetical protein
MNPIPDPRKLLNQLQMQTQANRYALLVRQANQRVINAVKG